MKNRIREIRKQRGLTLVQLAELANTTQPQILRLEKGERRLTQDWMERLGHALNVHPAELLQETVQQQESAARHDPEILNRQRMADTIRAVWAHMSGAPEIAQEAAELILLCYDMDFTGIRHEEEPGPEESTPKDAVNLMNRLAAGRR